MIYKLCQAYQALPDGGGVLAQGMGFLRMHAILNESGYFEDQVAGTSPSAPFDPLASLPMEAL